MEFEQKAEEKKMSMSKNIARLAVTAGLTAALSFGGVMAPVTMAFAAEGGTTANYVPTATTTGNVTIAENTYADTSFEGIQIFRATVTQGKADADGDGVADVNGAWNKDGEKTLSDITWASPDVKAAVMSVFDGEDYVNKPKNDDAQAWAEFIKEQAGSDNVGVGAKVNADNKLNVIAGKLINTKGLKWTDLANQQTKNLGAGYWLFVTKQPGSTKDANKTNGNDDAFTSPIFTIVGGADVNAEPKKSVPNVTKAVKDDASNGTFGDFLNPNKAADSAMDDWVDYKLVGTVASNINTYDKYYYEFKDELPGSMSAELMTGTDKPKVTVQINGDEVTSGYDATYENNVLKVVFTNLKACTCSSGPVTFNADTKVTVEYKAKLDSSKIFESGVMKADFQGLVGMPQKNKVTLTYSNNPHSYSDDPQSSDNGTTVEHPAYDYTYGIDVIKVGSDDETKGLEGVEFTLQEQGDTNNYIKADGTKTKNREQAKLTTDANGKINVVGLDEGAYVLAEVKPAPGYNNSHSAGIKFTITRGTLPADDATVVNPGCTPAPGTDTNLVKVAKTKTEAADGKVHLTVIDKKGSNLPLTGLNGVTFTWIAGGAVLCIGVAHLIRSRKQAEESEQE